MQTTANSPVKYRKPKPQAGTFVIAIIAFVLAFIILAPLLYCLVSSLMHEKEIIQAMVNPFRNYVTKKGEVYSRWSVIADNYSSALRMAPLFRFIANSCIVAGCCMAAQLFSGSLAGYAFGCLKFKGQNKIFLLFLATMMIPGNAIIISNYLTIAGMGILNTYAALILPYMTSAFCVFNMRQAYKSLPSELGEAATIDGANSFQYFLKVAAPLTLPSLGAVGIQTFITIWNQYMWPILVVNTKLMRTVQIGIGMLQNEDGQRYGIILAGTTIVLLPSVIVFIVGQKTLITGMTAGAVKG